MRINKNNIPIIIQTLTDNRNRTVAEIKHILEKSGGTMAGPNSVSWMFEKNNENSFVAKQKIEVNEETREKIQKLFDVLDENQDVTNYYTNI